MSAFEIRRIINLIEAETSSRLYFHGSMDELPVGTILRPRPEYESVWGDTSFYHGLERYRPSHMLGHAHAVFMCDNPDDVDLAGGGTEWLFTVKPLGPVERHDLNWSSEMSAAIDDGASEDRIREIAEAYWSGIPHQKESVWEYLTPLAEIVAVEPY